MDEPARNAVEAWTALREIGGMEIGGRDADLENALQRLLKPVAPNLAAALLESSTDDLVRALFDVISPFAAMFRDIIAFFRTAGANQGREQWTVKIDDEHIDLADFQTFLESFDSIEADLDLPAIDFHGAWALSNVARELNPDLDALRFLRGGAQPESGDPEIDTWLAAYAKGGYLPFPAKLQPGAVPAELSDAAAIVWAAVERVRAIWGDRERMMQDYRAYDGGERLLPSHSDDGFEPGTIAQNETDFWLGSSTVILSQAIGGAEADRQALGERLAAAYGAFDRRQIRFTADASVLERILSLPVWRRRHELYAVWIATQIVAALPDHDIELHHDGGRIVFAFKETVVATIETAQPTMRLFAERRVALENPVGEGRTANVQPDYSLWSGAAGVDQCLLVVEVKHYKKAARRRFTDVLVDYARAHPQATIALVNHGPVKDMVEGVAPAIVERCRQFGDLTAYNASQRAAFRDLLREIVGPPRAPASTTHSDTAVLVDISSSMQSSLQGADFAQWLESDDVQASAVIALADTEIRHRCPPAEAMARVRSGAIGNSTELTKPVEQLLSEYARVIVATDQDGLADLSRVRAHRVDVIAQRSGWAIVSIVRI